MGVAETGPHIPSSGDSAWGDGLVLPLPEEDGLCGRGRAVKQAHDTRGLGYLCSLSPAGSFQAQQRSGAGTRCQLVGLLQPFRDRRTKLLA